MLMHLYGSDSYRRNRAVREIIEKYQAKYENGTVGYVDCAQEDSVDELRRFAGAPGLFAKVSLAIVSNPADGEKPLIKFLKEVAEEAHVTVVVVADKKLPKDFSFLYEKGVGPAKKEFEPLTGIELLKFLKADAVEKGLVISDGQLKTIGETFGDDTWGAVTEIERAAFGGQLSGKKIEINFPAAMSLISGSGRLPERLKALLLLLESDDPAKIFNMAAGWARGAAKVRFADYDVAVKSGKLEYAEALLEYILDTR